MVFGKDIQAVATGFLSHFEAQARSIYLKKISIPQPQGFASRMLRPET